jgi:diacylglycerol kinase family enzyme
VTIVLVVNPFASRVSLEKLAAVRRELSRAGELTVLSTQRPRHATELVTEASRGDTRAIVVFSGDGGFNEALNGLDGDVPIAFLPGGGTSVLPRALGLPRGSVAAARQVADAIVEERTRRITVGRVNGRRFAFSAGLGLDAEAVRRVDELGRSREGKRPGDLAFVMAVLRSIAAQGGRLEPTLDVHGHGRASCVFVANASPYTYAKGLPLPIAPEASFELGLDIVAPVRIDRKALVPTAWAVLRGHPQSHRLLYGHDLDRVEISCDVPTPLQVDGEDLGDVQHVTFEAERDAVSVLV